MNSTKSFLLRRFLGLYIATLLASALAALVYIRVLGPGASSAMAAAIPVGAFVLLAPVLARILYKQGIAPARTVGRFISQLLEEDYAQADSEALAAAVPGLGTSLAELTTRYKQQLGFQRSFLGNLPIPVCIVDPHQKVTFLNQECLDMLGSKEEPTFYYGRFISQIFYRDDRKSKIADCMEDDTRAMNLPAIFKHADGSDINALINLFPLHDVEGNITGGCCLYLNTTELKRHEREITSQNERIHTAADKATAISTELAAAAEQLHNVVDQASQGTNEQTDRTNETATAMEEMNATVLEVANNAQEAAADATRARDLAEEGASIVRDVIAAIATVSQNASVLKASMEELDGRAENIGAVLGVIEDIADQTNLLALNAAIEAARAGEAGRGFAVVADEVRKLAEKTMLATNEVHAAVKGIQEGARSNVEATEVAVASVKRSTDLAAKSGEALNGIVGMSEATADRVNSIAAAAEQQSAASEQINKATIEVTRLCGETDQLMTEASAAIARLSELAESLTAVIGNMR